MGTLSDESVFGSERKVLSSAMKAPPETDAAGRPRTLTAQPRVRKLMEIPSDSDPALEELDLAYSYSFDRLVEGAIELAMLVAVFFLFILVLM
jgi:hypothetical protein